jgi:hypothetical protein
MSRAFYGLIKNWAESKGKVLGREAREHISMDSGTTLQRLLKGVITCTSEPMSIYSRFNHEDKESVQPKQQSVPNGLILLTPIDKVTSNDDMNTFRMLALSEVPLEKTLAGLMKHSPNVGSVDTVVVNDHPRQF